jgi:hypothetical protein
MMSVFSLNYDYIMIKYDYRSSMKHYNYSINRYWSQGAEYDMITLRYG